MAVRYWVGNGGNWNDTSHWSTTSGGSGGASVPTYTIDDYDVIHGVDNVIFDANSFSLTGQSVTLPTFAYTLDFNTSSVTNNPTFIEPNSPIATLVNSGNLNLTGTQWTFLNANSRIFLTGIGSNTLTFGGVQFPTANFMQGDNATTYTFLDSPTFKLAEFTPSSTMYLILSGQSITIQTFDFGSDYVLDITGGTINITGANVVTTQSNLITHGTTINLPGGTLQGSGDISTQQLSGATADDLTLTNNSGTVQTIQNIGLTNTVLNGTSSFQLNIIGDRTDDGGGNDWGGGGGGTGQQPKRFYVQNPPKYISAL